MRINPGTQRPESAIEIKWSDGPYDHPAEIKDAVTFARNNGLKTLTITSRSQEGIKHMDDVELSFVPTACFAYNLGKGADDAK